MTHDEIGNPRLTLVRNRYYDSDEVQRHLLRVSAAAQDSAERLSALEARNRELEADNRILSQSIRALEESGRGHKQTNLDLEQANADLAEDNQRLQSSYETLESQYQALYKEKQNFAQANQEFWQAHQELIKANQQQAGIIAAFREKASAQETYTAEQVREIEALGDQLSAYRNENVAQNERIAQQTMQISRLQSRVDRLLEQVSMLESQNPEEVVHEALHKADEIIRKAVADSDRIMLQATEQRGRLIAACRAAYYSALQFKQDLAEQFRNMEKELDASIDVLQLMDNTRLSLSHTADASEPVAPGKPDEGAQTQDTVVS